MSPIWVGNSNTGPDVAGIDNDTVMLGVAARLRVRPTVYLVGEIIPRVSQYIKLDGRFDDTSVWVQGERRLVFLKGCVRTREQSEALEKAVWLVDDVMGLVNYLRVGDEPVRYVPAQSASK